jgi:hypothetical protein
MITGAGLVVSIKAAGDMDPKTLDDAKKEAEMYTPKNPKDETLSDGWAFTFENAGSAGTNYWVKVRREMAGRAYVCVTTASQAEQQANALRVCKSLRHTPTEQPVPAVPAKPALSGIWTDPVSGLTWQNPAASERMSWSSAKSYCGGLDLAGYSDWRLPTISELRSLIRGCPATETNGSCNVKEGGCLRSSCRRNACKGCSYNAGPGTGGMYWPDGVEGPCCSYWSSSAVAANAGDAWFVHFPGGYVLAYDVNYDWQVRCVR